ncbi:glycogen synthase GlgA [Citreimonas salinaria]|uniref:Glycogen synthase n=1 Tax=Citreimonas salinaria TaxID=321339 RepID=A0A1H3F362_9RHOB|nr:glycogen synthase GlgA [Citreimonas salinaria]SDX85463.1 starch synthase [Citreimonas salinaria]
MKVLSVASECVPFIKTGGLADVVGALPDALARHGVEMRVLLPGYDAVLEIVGDGQTIAEEDDLFGGRGRVFFTQAKGVGLYVLDAPHLFRRNGSPYLDADGRDWSDNPERFAALSWMGARLVAQGAGGWRADVLHGHDWQAGLAPLYLRRAFRVEVPSVITVHNVAFHGSAPADRLDGLRLDRADFNPEGIEFWGQINPLKAGLVFSDRITTVSPTYARELTRPEFGAGLDGVIRVRADRLCGILNGIDTDTWDPKNDLALVEPYSDPAGKSANKVALRAEFGLPESDGPLCIVVSRMTQQKGLDLLLNSLSTLIGCGGQLAVLGSGDTALESAWQRAAAENPAVAVRIGYDEALSHRMMAGADAILVPSRFEPCGLTQLYALRYGTIPVVALTGGLADTVIPANPAALAANAATGIQFHPVGAQTLNLAILDLCALYADTRIWDQMRRNAMAQPVGWERSARAYADLYADMVAAQ